MNIRNIIIGCGLLVMVAMALYPPWTYQDENGSNQAMGYNFLWKPPARSNDAKADIFGLKIKIDGPDTKANSIDMSKLLFQEVIALAIVAGLVFLVRLTPQKA